MTADVFGSVPTIKFQCGQRTERQNYIVPRDTRDPRYAACDEHHPACDCREAELAEQLWEYRAEQKTLRRATARLLVGHYVKDYDGFGMGSRTRTEIGEEMWARLRRGDGPLACQCTGCKIVRAGEVQVWTDEHGVVTHDAEERVR